MVAHHLSSHRSYTTVILSFNLFWWIEYFIRVENDLEYHFICHTYKWECSSAHKIFPEVKLWKFFVQVSITDWSRARDLCFRGAGTTSWEVKSLMMEHKNSVVYSTEKVYGNTVCLSLAIKRTIFNNHLYLKLSKNKIWRDFPNITHCMDDKATNL